jgi:hypothetical protein
MYDLVNYSINKNRQEIEKLIEKETNQKIKLGDIHLSFSSLTISEIKYAHKNMTVNVKDVEVLPSESFLIGFDPNKLVQSIHIKSINISPKKDFTFEEGKPKDYSLYLKYIQGMKNLQIDKIDYSNILSIDKTVFEKVNGKLVFNTNAQYRKNALRAIGNIDLYKVLKTNKLDAEILVKSNRIELAQFNQFINNSNVILANGNVEVDEEINIKDNQVQFSGTSNIRNLQVNLFNKPMKVNDLKVKNNFSAQKIDFEFQNDIKVNNTPFYIKKVSLVTDREFKNLKDVTIESKQLKYHGVFSQNFNEDKVRKEIKVNFNVVDLNYFNKIGLLNIPKPYNETLVKDGVFNVVFNRDSDKHWHLDYTVAGDASLIVDNVLFEADGKLEKNKLSFNNFKLNKNKQEGVVNYDLTNNNFDLDIKVNVDRPIFAYIKNQYYVPFNINLLNDNVDFSLKLDHKDKQFIYNGSIGLNGNDASFDFKDSNYLVSNAKGKIDFSTHKIDLFDIKADKVRKGEYELNSVAVVGSFKEQVIDTTFVTPNFDSKLVYDINKEELKADVAHAKFETKNSNSQEGELLETEPFNIKSLELPKNIDVIVHDLNFNNLDIGTVAFKAKRQENEQYTIKGVMTNDVAKLNIISELDIKNADIKSSFGMQIENLEKFNKKYNLEYNIKDGTLKTSGNIEAKLDDLSLEGILDSSNGTINFESEKGEFTKLHSNAGFIINLLSFQTLPNIATLQFGNIFTNKLAYDSIHSSLILDGSDLKIDKLDIKSNISDASLKGVINLDTQELNIDLKVNPKISKSLMFTTFTVASGFNPLVMLGSTLLEKILPLPNIVEYNYKINGTVSYPVLIDNNGEIQKTERKD